MDHMTVRADTFSRVLNRLMTDSGFPGIQCAISRGDEPPLVFSWGRVSNEPDATPVSRETYFDLASLTKVVTTYPRVMGLLESNAINLETEVGTVLDGCSDWLSRVPLWRLLNHTSGLASHVEYYRDISKNDIPTLSFVHHKARIINDIRFRPSDYDMGTEQKYSDLGFILLGEIADQFTTLNGLAQEEALPFHSATEIHSRESQRTGFGNDTYAATEVCPWRNRLLQGEVHDDNCWLMGGSAGHAGQFGNIDDVHAYGQGVLAHYHHQTSPFRYDPQKLRMSLSTRYRGSGGSHRLGWDTVSATGSSTGKHFSTQSFGHLGFTGTSLWIDPEHKVVATILSNRVCPSRDRAGIKMLRPQLHDAMWELLHT